MLAVAAAYGAFFADADEAARTWKGIIATLAYVADWVRALGEFSLGPVTLAWSLSIEEQFYLLWPPLLGVLLWLRVPKRTVLILTLGVLLVMSYSVLWRERSMYFGLFTVAGLSSGVLIYGVFGAPSSVVARALSVEPLVWMGRLSYSLYLWHAPIIRWVGTEKREWAGWDDLVLETALTAVASVASYFLVEQPLRARVAARKPKLRVIPGDRRTRAPAGRPEIAAEAG